MYSRADDVTSMLYSYYIKYNRLFELNNQVDTITKTRIIDIYVDIYDMIRRVYNASVTGISRLAITSAIINLAAHIRTYYKTRHKTWARIFLVYGPEVTNNHRQFYNGFSNFMNISSIDYDRIDNLVKSQIELVKILAAYIDDVYYVERKTDFTMFVYDNIINTLNKYPNSVSIIISKNKYAYQIPAMMLGRRVYLFRPSKGNGEDRSICISPNTALTLYYHSINKVDVKARLQVINPELLSVMMTLNGCKDKGVNSLTNIIRASRMVDGAINCNKMLNSYQSDMKWVYNALDGINTITDFPAFDARFKALDLKFQYMLYCASIESKDFSWNLNLSDPDTIRDINNKYFIDNPLDLNGL